VSPLIFHLSITKELISLFHAPDALSSAKSLVCGSTAKRSHPTDYRTRRRTGCSDVTEIPKVLFVAESQMAISFIDSTISAYYVRSLLSTRKESCQFCLSTNSEVTTGSSPGLFLNNVYCKNGGALKHGLRDYQTSLFNKWYHHLGETCCFHFLA
jgi:hypothetical protein